MNIQNNFHLTGMAPPCGPPPTISVQDSDNEAGGLAIRRNSRPVSINFGASLESDYCRGLYDYDANGPDELSFKEDDVIHIHSRNPNGVDDGWWLGECNGRTGLFPSIVVEESAADGSDWSPDVSVCGSPPAFAPPPPSFEPPSMPQPSSGPPQRPPAPASAPPPKPPAPNTGGPPARPPVPKIVTASSSSPASSSDSESEKSEEPVTTLIPQTQIMITNPTPLVENETDPKDSDPSSSYYVEDSSFSMKMSDDKKEKYQNSVPVEVNVVVEPMRPIKIKLDSDDDKPKPEMALINTEIVVTAPTPRNQSPEQEDQEPLFTCTSESESEAGGAAVQESDDWANFGSTSTEVKADDKHQENGGNGWANFANNDKPDVEEKPSTVTGKQTENWAAFNEPTDKPIEQLAKPAEKTTTTIIPQVSITEPEPEPKLEPEPSKPTQSSAVSSSVTKPPVTRPSAVSNVIRQVRIVETETSDFASDSESEVINTNLQIAATDTDYGVSSATDAGPDSSDTESEDNDGGKKTSRDSSETESGSEPEDTSRETPSPHPSSASSKVVKDIQLPPVEPKQLKKLEPMKESPA